jgi:hypothetical protein
MKNADAKDNAASKRITQYVIELKDWRGKRLAEIRKLILAADPEMVEEWKWETPVWSHNGNVLAVGAFKDYLKINFFKGDLHEADKINAPALKELVLGAVALNAGKPKAAKK